MRRKTLALLLAAALTVTSVEGTVLVSGADFTAETSVQGTDTELFSTEQEMEDAEEAPVDLGEADPQSETDTTFETEDDISENEGADIFTDQEDESGSEEIDITEDESDEPTDEIEVFAEPEDDADGEEETEFTDEETAASEFEVQADDGESSSKQITGIQVRLSEITMLQEYQAYWENCIPELLTFEYGDGSVSEAEDVFLGSAGIMDNYGNAVVSGLFYEDGKTLFEWRDDQTTAQRLPEGSYIYRFTYTPENQSAEDQTQEAPAPITAEVNLKVKTLAEMYPQFPLLTEGTRDITVSDMTYYRFEPQKSGTYTFTNLNLYIYYRITEVVDGEFTENYFEGFQGSGISAKLDQGKNYVVEVMGTTNAGNTTLQIERIPEITSVEIVACNPGKELTFIEGEGGIRFKTLNVRINTDAGSRTLKINGGNTYGSMRDGDNILRYELYKVRSEGFAEINFSDPNVYTAGEYAFRVFYGASPANLTEAKTYIPVHIISRESLAGENILTTKTALTVDVVNGNAVCSFTPEESGRYEMGTSVRAASDIECSLCDSEGKAIAHASYDCASIYASLNAGTTYYMTLSNVSSYKAIEFTAKKVPMPVSLSVSVKRTEYSAEEKTLEDVDPEITVTYDDGSKEIAKFGDMISGWYLEYMLMNKSTGATIISDTAKIPEGTWHCIPKLYSSDSGYKEDVTVSEAKITVTAPKLNISEEVLKLDVPVTVEETNSEFYQLEVSAGTLYKVEVSKDVTVEYYEWDGSNNIKRINYTYITAEEGKKYLVHISAYRQAEITLRKTTGPTQYRPVEKTYELKAGFAETITMPAGESNPVRLSFTFTPEESAVYTFETESDASIFLSISGQYTRMRAERNPKLTNYLQNGEEYTYVIEGYMDELDEIRVSFKKKADYQPITGFELILKEGMKATDFTVLDGLTNVYDIVIKYKDGSSTIWNGWDTTDMYGNTLDISYGLDTNDAEREESKCIVYMNGENAIDDSKAFSNAAVPVKGVRGMQGLNTEDTVYPFKKQKTVSAYYTFTPDESGEYLWKINGENGEPAPEFSICTYTNVSFLPGMPIALSRVNLTVQENTGYSAWLEAGETYLVRIDTDSVEYNRNLALSVVKAKAVKSVQIKKYPNQKSLYGLRNYAAAEFDGMVITVQYTDGTSEDIAYGQSDSEGTVFERDIDKDRGIWTNGKYRCYLHFKDHSFYVEFETEKFPAADAELPILEAGKETRIPTSDKTVAVFRFAPTESGFYSVAKSDGSYSVVVDEETQEQRIGTVYYLEKGKSYLVFVEPTKADDTVTIWRSACEWKTIAKTKATCTEDATYTRRCDIHDHTYTYSDAYAGKAYGHAYSTWKVAKEATCGEDGTEERTCEYCGNVEKRTIKATGKHSFGSWKTIKEATVLNNGQKERICSVCKKKETASIAKLKATAQLNVSGTLPLKVKQTFTPKVTMGKGDKVVSWKSSNKKVASVDKNGKVKGLKAGKTATITVQLASGLKKSFKVKVQKANVATKSIKVLNASTGKKMAAKATLKRNATLKLQTTVLPVTSKEKVTYSSSNKKIVTVSSKGVIKAKKKGKVTITVKSGKKSYKIKVTVK